MTRLDSERYAILRHWEEKLADSKTPLTAAQFRFIHDSLPSYQRIQILLTAAARECSERVQAIQHNAHSQQRPLTQSMLKEIDRLRGQRYNYFRWAQIIGPLDKQAQAKRALRQAFYHGLVADLIDQCRHDRPCLMLMAQTLDMSLSNPRCDLAFPAIATVLERLPRKQFKRRSSRAAQTTSCRRPVKRRRPASSPTPAHPSTR